MDSKIIISFFLINEDKEIQASLNGFKSGFFNLVIGVGTVTIKILHVFKILIFDVNKQFFNIVNCFLFKSLLKNLYVLYFYQIQLP